MKKIKEEFNFDEIESKNNIIKRNFKTRFIKFCIEEKKDIIFWGSISSMVVGFLFLMFLMFSYLVQNHNLAETNKEKIISVAKKINELQVKNYNEKNEYLTNISNLNIELPDNIKAIKLTGDNGSYEILFRWVTVDHIMEVTNITPPQNNRTLINKNSMNSNWGCQILKTDRTFRDECKF